MCSVSSWCNDTRGRKWQWNLFRSPLFRKFFLEKGVERLLKVMTATGRSVDFGRGMVILFAKYFDLYVTLSRQTRQCRWLLLYHVCLNRWGCLISLFMAHLKGSCVWWHCSDLFNILGTVKWRMGVCHYCMWPSTTLFLVIRRTCHTWEIAAVEQLMINWFHFSARCLIKLSPQKSSKDLMASILVPLTKSNDDLSGDVNPVNCMYNEVLTWHTCTNSVLICICCLHMHFYFFKNFLQFFLKY